MAQVYEFLRSLDEDPIELTQQEIKEQLGLPIGADGVGNCEQLLEKAGVLERLEPCQNMAIVRIDSDLPTLRRFAAAAGQGATARAAGAWSGSWAIGGNELVYFRPQELAAATGNGSAGGGPCAA